MHIEGEHDAEELEALLKKDGFQRLPFLGPLLKSPEKDEGLWHTLLFGAENRMLVVGIGNDDTQRWFKPCPCKLDREHLTIIAKHLEKIGSKSFNPDS